MQRLVFKLSLLVLLTVLPPTSFAETPYVSGGVGFGIPHDSDLDGAGADRSADLDFGFAGVAAFGYEFGKALRGELELGYRTNDTDDISGASASGDYRTLSGMANLLYDLDLGSPVRPFLGVGIGIANVDADALSPVGSTRIDDGDTGFAYQVIAGAEYTIDDRLALSLSYRYFSVPDLTFDADSGASVDSDYAAHAVMFGLRYRFAPPKPAPEPAAAPAPPPPAPVVQRQPEPKVDPAQPVPRTYIVFFEFDKSDITPEAREIIVTAAQNAITAGLSRVITVGHADRSGPTRYNIGLSQRRAVAVKSEFVRLGIGADEIAIFARGESQPLVPTRDGVREPRNRRVEIELQ